MPDLQNLATTKPTTAPIGWRSLARLGMRLKEGLASVVGKPESQRTRIMSKRNTVYQLIHDPWLLASPGVARLVMPGVSATPEKRQNLRAE